MRTDSVKRRTTNKGGGEKKAGKARNQVTHGFSRHRAPTVGYGKKSGTDGAWNCHCLKNSGTNRYGA
jgi:hypothetical protein